MTSILTKYPRTPHLPWSPGYTHDDIRNKATSFFHGKKVVVLEKMDGECTTMYPNHIHARSLDSVGHPSRDWVKIFHASLCYEIPNGWRFCGENLYAKHSIYYQELESFFYLFAIYNELNWCLDWDDTVEYADLLGITTPKVFYAGTWNEDAIKAINLDLTEVEGYVVRLKESFSFDDFSRSVAKWVRKNHVTTDEHWMRKAVIPNLLKVK